MNKALFQKQKHKLIIKYLVILPLLLFSYIFFSISNPKAQGENFADCPVACSNPDATCVTPTGQIWIFYNSSCTGAYSVITYSCSGSQHQCQGGYTSSAGDGNWVFTASGCSDVASVGCCDCAAGGGGGGGTPVDCWDDEITPINSCSVGDNDGVDTIYLQDSLYTQWYVFEENELQLKKETYEPRQHVGVNRLGSLRYPSQICAKDQSCECTTDCGNYVYYGRPGGWNKQPSSPGAVPAKSGGNKCVSNFIQKMTGFINIPTSGTYHFEITHNGNIDDNQMDAYMALWIKENNPTCPIDAESDKQYIVANIGDLNIGDQDDNFNGEEDGFDLVRTINSVDLNAGWYPIEIYIHNRDNNSGEYIPYFTLRWDQNGSGIFSHIPNANFSPMAFDDFNECDDKGLCVECVNSTIWSTFDKKTRINPTAKIPLTWRYDETGEECTPVDYKVEIVEKGDMDINTDNNCNFDVSSPPKLEYTVSNNNSIDWDDATNWSIGLTNSQIDGTGNLQAYTFFALPDGNSYIQGYWRGDLAYVRTVPVVNNELDFSTATTWTSSGMGIPGSGEPQTLITFKRPDGQYEQKIIRGGVSHYRIVPVDGNNLLWGSANWVTPDPDMASLPGSGHIDAQYIFPSPDGTSYIYSISRGGTAYVYSVPISGTNLVWNNKTLLFQDTYPQPPMTGSRYGAESFILPDSHIMQRVWHETQEYVRYIPIEGKHFSVPNNTLDWDKTYCWRVTANIPSGSDVISEIYTFRTNQPPNFSSADLYFDNSGPTPTPSCTSGANTCTKLTTTNTLGGNTCWISGDETNPQTDNIIYLKFTYADPDIEGPNEAFKQGFAFVPSSANLGELANKTNVESAAEFHVQTNNIQNSTPTISVTSPHNTPKPTISIHEKVINSNNTYSITYKLIFTGNFTTNQYDIYAYSGNHIYDLLTNSYTGAYLSDNFSTTGNPATEQNTYQYKKIGKLGVDNNPPFVTVDIPRITGSTTFEFDWINSETSESGIKSIDADAKANNEPGMTEYILYMTGYNSIPYSKSINVKFNPTYDQFIDSTPEETLISTGSLTSKYKLSTTDANEYLKLSNTTMYVHNISDKACNLGDPITIDFEVSKPWITARQGTVVSDGAIESTQLDPVNNSIPGIESNPNQLLTSDSQLLYENPKRTLAHLSTNFLASGRNAQNIGESLTNTTYSNEKLVGYLDLNDRPRFDIDSENWYLFFTKLLERNHIDPIIIGSPTTLINQNISALATCPDEYCYYKIENQLTLNNVICDKKAIIQINGDLVVNDDLKNASSDTACIYVVNGDISFGSNQTPKDFGNTASTALYDTVSGFFISTGEISTNEDYSTDANGAYTDGLFVRGSWIAYSFSLNRDLRLRNNIQPAEFLIYDPRYSTLLEQLTKQTTLVVREK